MHTIWNERWRAPEQWLQSLEDSLRSRGASVRRGGNFDSWDLEVRGGALGSARIKALVEEHGQGRQFVRLRSCPRWRPLGPVVSVLFLLLSLAPALAGNWDLTVVLITVALVLGLRAVQECAGAMAEVLRVIDKPAVSLVPRPRELNHPTTIRS